MGDVLEFKPRNEKDLIIASGERIIIQADSLKAKNGFLEQMARMIEKNNELRNSDVTCGDCAAYPCFRSYPKEGRAGLCFQEERSCRQECNYFIQNRGSGKSPDFQITGMCKRDGTTVDYQSRCRFID